MSQKKQAENTFAGGVVQDVDKIRQPNNTLRYGRNLSILYNRDPGDTEGGKSMSMSPKKGTKYLASVCDGYYSVGSVDTRSGLVQFLTNGTNSEIGMLKFNGDGTANYTTLFNDSNDPNGDLIGFSGQEVRGEYVYENGDKERVYFVQEGMQRMVMNISLCYDKDGVPYHTSGCSAGSEYPKWMSVHAMKSRMDCIFPDTMFERRIGGQLKSGVYQFFMRYRSMDGYESLFSYPTMPIFVTTKPLDGNPDNYLAGYRLNHHNRTMGESNVMTNEGIRWRMDNIDKRWDFVEVGYIYHISDTGFIEANIFDRVAITGSSMEFDLVKHTGRPVSQGQLNQRIDTILSSGTVRQQEGRMFDGNIKLLPPIEFDTDSAEIVPKVRTYIPDIAGPSTFEEVYNPGSGKKDGDPITNTLTENSTIEIQAYIDASGTPVMKEYPIREDYRNYKGQQFQSVMRSHFRGETYPYAVVLFDIKGNPMFAKHIQDFTFPEQFEDGFELMEEGANNVSRMRILGAVINNIRLRDSEIRDSDGKLLVSGFMIVRADRIKRIAHQGVMFPCAETNNCNTNTKNDSIVRPLPHISNNFQTEYGNVLGLHVGPKSTDSHHYNAYRMFCRETEADDTGNENKDSQNGYSSPFMATYHSPDVLIEGSIKELENSDVLRHVGHVHSKYTPEIQIRGGTKHVYNKCYNTTKLNDSGERERIAKGRPKLGQDTKISFSVIHNGAYDELYEDIDRLFPGKKLSPLVGVDLQWCKKSEENFSSLQPNSVFVKMDDVETVDIHRADSEYASYRIFNYIQVPDNYYTQEGETSLESRSYYPIGHYQRITEETLSSVPHGSNNGKEYIFNGVEVWGGDCYPSLFDFTRLYPVYSAGCSKICDGWFRDGDYPDYAVSHVIPIESKYNLSLLNGRKFSANATNPQITGCTNNYQNLSNGIMLGQPESWAYNRVLNSGTGTYRYVSMPSDVEIVTDVDSAFVWSPLKTYGESSDSFRVNYPSDMGNVIGSYGKIMGFQKAFGYLYVIQERAFGAMLVNSREFLNTDASQIVLSTGNVFSGVRYVRTNSGTAHISSIWEYDNNFGFVDSRNGKIIRFGQNGVNKISEMDNMDDFVFFATLNQDGIYSGPDGIRNIVSGVDPESGSLYFTFHSDKKETLSYSQSLSEFNGFYDFFPSIYMNRGRYMISQRPDYPMIYVHGMGNHGHFYGKYFDSVARFVVNPESQVNKRYDNGMISVSEGGERIYRILHESRDSVHDLSVSEIRGNSVVITDDRFEYSGGKITYPMHEIDPNGKKSPLRGEILEITLFIANFHTLYTGNDTMVSISSFRTNFRNTNPIR